MSRFTIEVDGQAEFSRAFNRGVDRIKDLSPIWEEVKQEFFEIQREQFTSEGAAGAAGKWQELSPAYAEVKAQKWGSKPILQASGRLYTSLTQEGGDNVSDIRKQEASFGTVVPYALAHQRGNRVPKREVISFSEKQKNRLMKRIQKKLIEEMRALGIAR